MARLSSPIENLRAHYPIVVVGSGYGGGIAASRLARAGQQVCVLERGKELQPGEYPDTETEALQEMQIDVPQKHLGSRAGLYDIRVNADINVVVGCGLGGTSLINANVSLPTEPAVFDDPCWPQALRDDRDTLLQDGYRHAEEMLKPVPYPADAPPLQKLKALEKSAAALGGRFYRPPIHVSFKEGVNHVGVEQHRCQLCGDCVSGCNYSAKNTVLMNYLPDAKNHEAEIYTQVAVQRIESKDDHWLVHYDLLDTDREEFDAPTMFVSADIVVLAAGTLGSTEILLRSQAAGLSLSPELGKQFSGNGDVFAFGYNNDEPINGIGFGHRSPDDHEPVGPCITGIIDLRNQPDVDKGLVIEEGSIPGALSSLLPPAFAAADKFIGKDTDSGIRDSIKEGKREAESVLRGPYVGALQNTQTYLVMSHDDGGGRMYLKNDRLRIDWPGIGTQPLFKRIDDLLLDATRPLGGTYIKNPTWNKWTNNNLTTVHPLGGCVMAEDAEQGVVNHKGQVFLGRAGTDVYDGLYVSDGSIIPRSLGVNPLLTISALAERACFLLAKDRGWQINYTLPSHPHTQPQAQQLGLRFTETMCGHFSTKMTDTNTHVYERAARQGEQDNSLFEFTLTVITHDLQHMLDDPQHEAKIVGSVTASALSEKPLTITDGVFNLFTVAQDRTEAREMRYRMRLVAEDGTRYYFDGFKVVRDDPGADLWSDTTTLYVTVYAGDSENSRVLGKGILRIAPDDFLKQLTTIEVTNAESLTQRLKAIANFGYFFAGALYDTYGGVFSRLTAFNKDPVPRKKRLLRTAAPQEYFFQTEDNVSLRLLRYEGGKKGPVVLSHAFGTSSLVYTIDTIETNLTEYLYAKDYDVWLLDYRASAELPASSMQFSIDEIAAYDYPAAVQKVLKVTKAKDLQIVAHCVGSMSFLMAMSLGLTGVRSAVCSQLAAHPTAPAVTHVKAALRIPSALNKLGLKEITPVTSVGKQLRSILRLPEIPKDLGLFDQAVENALKLAPSQEQCHNPVCRRILFIYGETYKHDQLNTATHDAIHEMFGMANLSALKHMALMVRKRKIVNKNGEDVYPKHFDRLAMPIAFIHGEENREFLPRSTEKTFKLLCKENGEHWYTRHVIPNYGHMDCFVGKDAARDVFPIILEELEKHNPTRGELTRRIEEPAEQIERQERLVARRDASGFYEESLALSNLVSWEVLGWLKLNGPMNVTDILERLGQSRDAFDAVCRLYLVDMVKFSDGILSITPLGEKTLEEFGFLGSDL